MPNQPEGKRSARVLLVDREPSSAQFFQSLLDGAKTFSFVLESVPTIQNGIDRLSERGGIDLILMCLFLPDAQDMDAFSKLKAIDPCLPIIVIDPLSERPSLEMEFLLLGVQDYFVKSRIEEKLFVRVAEHAVERKKIMEELVRQKNEQQMVFNLTHTMIWLKDKENKILRVNKAVADFFGVPASEIEGRYEEEVYPDPAEESREEDRGIFLTGKHKLGVLIRYPLSNGEHRWIKTDKVPFFDMSGKVSGILVFATDITDQKRAEDELEYRLRFERLVTGFATQFIHLTSDKLDSGISQALEDIGRFADADRCYIFQFADDGATFQNTYEKCAPGVEPYILRLKGLRSEDFPWFIPKIKRMETVYVPRVSDLPPEASEEKEEFQFEGIQSMICVPLIYESRPVGFLGFDWIKTEKQLGENFQALLKIIGEMFVNVLERKKAQERLDHLVYYDALTDLPNRALFVDRLNQAIVRARLDRNKVVVLHMDLDQFKRVNDTLNHAIGDQLLQEVAQRLRGALFETDTVTRLGADEFAVLLPKIRSSEDVLEIADKIFNALKTPFIIQGHELHMSCSIGSCCYPDDGETAEALLKNADAAKYHAKRQGRNAYKHYTSVMNAKSLERLVLENRLRHAIEEEELRVYYQPQVHLATCEITGVEALVRWQHPELGIVPPADFIPLAEETGLIIPLGKWVLQTACLQNKAWQQEGIKPIRVSVNLSTLQFQNNNFVETVSRILAQTRLDPACLELELTESMIMKSVEETIGILGQLKAMGVRVSIDDFGTGHSSLGYLKRFPIDTLKIDRSFVRDLTVDPDDATIAKAIISLANNLRLEVIAEGVETHAQLDFLRENNCDKVQGFLFSKPIPAEECKQLLMRGGFYNWSGAVA